MSALRGPARFNARLLGRPPSPAEPERTRPGAPVAGSASATMMSRMPSALYLESLGGHEARRLRELVHVAGAEIWTADGDGGRALLFGTWPQLASISAGLQPDLPELSEAIASAAAGLARRSFSLRLPRGRRLDVSGSTRVMGILNVTPDSFSDGGRFLDPSMAVAHARRMVDDGADLVDIGGESTRPQSEAVPPAEQIRRVAPVLREVRRLTDVAISIDTQSAEVAAFALDEGADLVNDVTSLRGDERMAALVAERGVPVILMHMLGTPRTMQQSPRYDDVMADISRFLRERVQAAVSAGIAEEQILVDPGLGFGKTLEHNLTILRRLEELHGLGRPVVVGPSRKSMIGMVLGRPVERRLAGTAAAVAAGVARGAHIVRVHDVAEMRDVAHMTEAIERGHT